MKKNMRFFITLLAFLLIGAMLAGCGTSTAPGIDKTTQPESEQEIVFSKTGLPIVSAPVTYRLAGIKSSGFNIDDFSELEIIQRYERETNVHFQYETYEGAAWETQKQIIAASKDLPDAFGMGNPLTHQDSLNFGAQGILIPLKQLAEEYAPRFKRIMTQYPAYFKSFLTPEGDFYAFPTHYDIDFGNRLLINHVNKEWLMEVRPEYQYKPGKTIAGYAFEYLDENITIDEYYSILKDMQRLHPDGIMQTSGYIPSFHHIYNAYGILEIVNEYERVYIEDGKVIFSAMEEGWKNATKFAHTLYREGLYDQEIYTQNNDIWHAKIRAEEPIVGFSMMWTALEAVPGELDHGDFRFKNFVPVKPLVGPEGKQQWAKSADGVNVPASFAITNRAKNPEILVRYQDYLYDELNSLESSYGMWGVGLIDNGDGTYSQKYGAAPTPTEKMPNTMFITTKEMNSKVIFDVPTALPQDVSKHCVKPFQNPDATYPMFLFSEEDTRKIAQLKTDLNKYITQKQAEYVVNGGIEEDWERFKGELEKIGVNEYVKIMQDNYERYVKLK